jgi:hypothetical protein
MKKIKVLEEKQIYLTGTIESAISTLHSYKEEGWENIEITKTCYEYDPNEYPVCIISKYRPETDKEYEKRMEAEDITKEAQKERDLKEYERLKKKFENS